MEFAKKQTLEMSLKCYLRLLMEGVDANRGAEIWHTVAKLINVCTLSARK